MEGIAALGELVVAGETLFTPWFPRIADNAVFTYEILVGGTAFTVEVLHKNTEDTGAGTANSTGSFSQIGSSGIFTGEFDDLKELVRFKITAGTEQASRYRFLDSTWFNKAHG